MKKYNMNACLRILLCWVICTPCVAQRIINKYSPVTEICGLLFTLKYPGEFMAGDSVLIIQMQGATPDLSNTANFGNITAIGSAGNYEFSKIDSLKGDTATLRYKPNRSFDVEGGVQIIKVPLYKGNTSLGNLTCLPWDGEKGGVLVLAAESLTLNGDIDVSGKGFRAGQVIDIDDDDCDFANYYLPESNHSGGQKGEGIVTLLDTYARAAGKAANGGGGGNKHNGGGGGGGNVGQGGQGGYFLGCDPAVLKGQGGLALKYYYTQSRNRIFMGGAGGAGHSNEEHGTSGGHGGGIVIISANTIRCQGYFIRANGGTPPPPKKFDGDGLHDGGGGGGAGGAVLIAVDNPSSTVLNIEANGSDGSSVNDDHGNGGGGGGGAIRINHAKQNNWDLSAFKGKAGHTRTDATAGDNGLITSDLKLPQTTDPSPPLSFSKITSVPECDGSATILLEVKGAVGQALYSINNGAALFPKGTFKNQIAGVYRVFAKDGCSTIHASLSVVTYPPLTIDPFVQPFRCDSLGFVEPNLTGGKPPFRFWLGSRPQQNKPLFKDLWPGNYSFKVLDERNCPLLDTFTVEDATAPIPLEALPKDATVARGDTITLYARSKPPYDAQLFYTWKPTFGLSDVHAARPVFMLEETMRFYLTVRDQYGCLGYDSLEVTVRDDTIYIANVFKPEGSVNPENAIFVPQQGRWPAKIRCFQIFNRFGNILFERRDFMAGDLDQAWDGTKNGKPLNPGVFVYRVEVVFTGGKTKVYWGDVSLVR